MPASSPLSRRGPTRASQFFKPARLVNAAMIQDQWSRAQPRSNLRIGAKLRLAAISTKCHERDGSIGQILFQVHSPTMSVSPTPSRTASAASRVLFTVYVDTLATGERVGRRDLDVVASSRVRSGRATDRPRDARIGCTPKGKRALGVWARLRVAVAEATRNETRRYAIPTA